jgi:hypothetical protein
MSNSGNKLRNIIISKSQEILTAIESELLRDGLIKEGKPTPEFDVIAKRVTTYIGQVAIDQTYDGTVTRAVFIVSANYFKELWQQKLFGKMLQILIAHVACTVYFPHDPCPGTFYWTKVMDHFGYFRAPTRVPGFPPVICRRKRAKQQRSH